MHYEFATIKQVLSFADQEPVAAFAFATKTTTIQG